MKTRIYLLTVLLGMTTLGIAVYWNVAANHKVQFDAADPTADSGIALGSAAWMGGGAIILGVLVISSLIVAIWTWRGVANTGSCSRESENIKAAKQAAALNGQ